MSPNAQPPIYPPPTMLPPPVPPSTSNRSSSSPGRKRRREREEAAPSSSYAASSASSASEFSQATKKKVARIDDGDTCWHCGARPTDICHVLGKKDRSFSQLVQRGLITFDHLGHVDNAIPLCPTCHRNFDDINHPGLVFLPSDLQYFIDFENENFRSRQTLARNTGSVPPRTCPTPQMYLEHQVRTDAVSEDASGGLYLRYTLYDYFHTFGPKNTWIPGLGPFQEPEQWHGAPMAALWRAFLILGNPFSGIPDKEKRLLRELQDLYQRQIFISGAETSADVGGDEGNERQGPRGTPTQNVCPSNNPNPTAQAPGLDRATSRPSRETRGSGQEDHNVKGNASTRGSAVDSAVGLPSEVSKRQAQDPKPGNALAKQQTIEGEPSDIAAKQQPQTQTKIRTRTQTRTQLPRHRPRSQPKQQLWKWGPFSSSENKVFWFPKMMGWIED
ncbi:hypothetical protein B0A49_09877 [Cryomyces minteri]|uniref:HNH nuclease domain-containing protein n=1 Tax=Cryomyces minteri TaxID=331657 RepID=A0A4U0XED0_9PEZI|nr:hypothetical protein B0A49_09877 [Cryomyces minteri]